MVIGLGQEERAAMFLQLESVVKEFKEQKWKLGQASNVVAELDMYLKADRFSDALVVLERPEKRVVLDNLRELLQIVLKLESQKVDLEKQLGVKIAFE